MCFLKTLARNVSLKNFAFHCLSPISPILLFCALHFCSMSGILFDFSRSSRPQKLQKALRLLHSEIQKRKHASCLHHRRTSSNTSSAFLPRSRPPRAKTTPPRERLQSRSLARTPSPSSVRSFVLFCVCVLARAFWNFILNVIRVTSYVSLKTQTRNLFLFSLLCMQSSFSRARALERVFSLQSADPMLLLFSLSVSR